MDTQYQKIYEAVSDAVKAGKGIAQIRAKFTYFPEDLLNDVIDDFSNDMDAVYQLYDPEALISKRVREPGTRWYSGPNENSVRWNKVLKKFEKSNLDEASILSLNRASTRVVSLLPSPALETFSGKGLVLGYVQSGKTTNFIATIAKVADEGYRLIVVLSGVTNNLRNQTQARLEGAFSVDDQFDWHWLTSETKDFDISTNATSLLGNPENRLIAVVKKNKGRLEKLTSWLNSATDPARQGAPFLLIDDEADQASVNSAKNFQEQTKINKLITHLLDPTFMAKSAYVGYTATPFANILADAKNPLQIYPRDFIIPLSKSKDYFGAEELFGRDPIDEDDQEISSGRDIVRGISAEAIRLLGNASNRTKNQANLKPELCKPLENSIYWFIIATSIRRIREGRTNFSTLLVHTSGQIAPHFEMKGLIEKKFESLRTLSQAKLAQELEEVWLVEGSRAHFENDAPLPSWKEISEKLIDVVNETVVVVDNYRSDTRLKYDFENQESSPPYIVVGGNTLARGLTLEGLTSSFFLRTSTAYDSLLQMGRWFGYRRNYEDLQRIWMQDDLIPLFKDMALIEEEIRQQIAGWSEESVPPDDIPLKIRTHARLAITSRDKMQHAVKVQIGFANQRVETIAFKPKKEWLTGNIQAAENFISAINKSGFSFDKSKKGWPIANDVPWTIVRNFLDEYEWVEGARKATRDLLTSYIENVQADKNELDLWNVFIYRLQTPGKMRTIGSQDFSVINRSALEGNNNNIHHLVSAIDGAADLGLLDKEVKNQLGGRITDKTIISLRENLVPGKKGLLGLYLVDRQSKATVRGRVDLDFPEDLLGLGFFLPTTSSGSSLVEYMAAQLPEIENVYLDEPDLEEIESADE